MVLRPTTYMVEVTGFEPVSKRDIQKLSTCLSSARSGVLMARAVLTCANICTVMKVLFAFGLTYNAPVTFIQFPLCFSILILPKCIET